MVVYSIIKAVYIRVFFRFAIVRQAHYDKSIVILSNKFPANMRGKFFENDNLHNDRTCSVGIIKNALRKFEWMPLRNEINVTEARIYYLLVSPTNARRYS